MQYVIETRDYNRLAGVGQWGPWTDLTPCTRYSRDEALDFGASLTRDDFGTWGSPVQWRARRLPAFGYEVFELTLPRKREPADPPLSRDMPASVHALNDRVLSALGL